MDRLCPICQRKLTRNENSKHVDYDCFPPKADHHYVTRLTADGQSLKTKIRLSPDKNKFYLKVHHDENYSEVWANSDSDEQKVKINHVIEPDLTNTEALYQKLKTYMVFS